MIVKLCDISLFSYRWQQFLFCSQFGFSLGRTLIDAINPYVHNHLDGCLLQNVSNLKTEQKD